MSNEQSQLLKTLEAIGPPDEVESDPRAGNALIWGTHETGLFYIFAGPVSQKYEVYLKSPDHSILVREYMTCDELNRWGMDNLPLIKKALGKTHE